MPNEPLEEYKFKEQLELESLNNQSSETQKISCPSCAKQVPANDLNIHTNIAKCSSCDVIFSFKKKVELLSNQHSISQEILQPEGVELNYFGDELDISVEQPWGVFEVIFISLFPLLVLIMTGIFIESFPSTDLTRTFIISFWLTSFIGYIAYFFIRKRHKMYIHIDDHNLHIERRPRKFVKDKKYAVQDIDQVYVKNVMTSGGTKGVGVFMIVNGVKGQKHVELIKSVNSRSKAKYIEQEIENYLGIPNRKVPDEDA